MWKGCKCLQGQLSSRLVWRDGHSTPRVTPRQKGPARTKGKWVRTRIKTISRSFNGMIDLRFANSFSSVTRDRHMQPIHTSRLLRLGVSSASGYNIFWIGLSFPLIHLLRLYHEVHSTISCSSLPARAWTMTNASCVSSCSKVKYVSS